MKLTDSMIFQSGYSSDYMTANGLIYEATDSMIIHPGESSDHTSIDEGEFWSLSKTNMELVQIHLFLTEVIFLNSLFCIHS
jgi:hypothetical protein